MHVPRTMFAAAIDRFGFGGPEAITPHALLVPEVDADEVLIAVDTAGVGGWDADVREGSFATRKPHFPLVPGYDGTGIMMRPPKGTSRLPCARKSCNHNRSKMLSQTDRVDREAVVDKDLVRCRKPDDTPTSNQEVIKLFNDVMGRPHAA